MQANSKRRISKFLAIFFFLSTFLLTSLGFAPTSFAITAATVTVPGTIQVQASSATTNITGVSISGLSGTILVAVGLSNFPANAVLRLPTTTGLTASYGFTSGSNIFASFTNISFTGTLANVNTALAALQYVSGATGTSNPTVKITATTSDAGISLNGSNGHFYRSSSPTTANYTTATTGARDAAKASTYKGQSGYVVTITSENENTFVSTAIESAANIWIGATDELSEGVWRWDTSGGSPEAGIIFWNGAAAGSSPAGQYAKWASGEPNDWSSAEDYAVTNWNGGTAWNDCNNSACGSGAKYVIEYGTNAADGGFVNVSSDLGSGTFTLFYIPTLTGTTLNLNVTFGTAAYETVTATNGTGNKTFVLTSSPVNAGITLNTSTTNQAVLIVASGVDIGTYYETITATDTVGNAGTRSLTITVVLAPSSFNSLALAGSVTTAIFRTAVVITANVTVASKVTFRVNGKVLPGCKGKSTAGSVSSHSVTCTWKPSNRGTVSLNATATPTGAGIANASAAPINIWVAHRIVRR